MTKKELLQLQNEQFNMLKEVVKVCKKHDINYYLVYGTLLGAIRHHGTIPWDNDVDICMDRENHAKFIEVANELPETLEIGHVGSGENTYMGLSRVYKKESKIYTDDHGEEGAHGIQIDIFILDYAKKYSGGAKKIVTALAKYLSVAKLSKYEKAWIYENFSDSFLKRLVVRSGDLIKIFFSEATIEKWVNNLLVAKNGSENFTILQDLGKEYPVHYFAKGKDVEYEGEMVNAPEEYEKLLVMWYGDYMQLPPEDERFTTDMEKWKIVF